MAKNDKNKRQSFFSHLLWSHMSIAAIGAGAMTLSLAIIFFQAGNIHILAQSSIPVARASSSVLRGVQHSLASMRGWVSLNDDQFVKDWYLVWKQEISPAVIKLNDLGSKMELPGFKKRMAELNLLLAELKESQWWILEVAQTPGNEPAKVEYQFAVEPILQTLDEIFTAMQDIVVNQTNSPQSIEMSNIHDTVVSFYTTREMLRKIVFQGETGLTQQYGYNLQVLNTAVAGLAKTLPTSNKLEQMMFLFSREISALEKVSAKTIELRMSNNWNVVRRLMETETVPLAKKVVKVMNSLTRETDDLMTRHITVTTRTGNIAALWLSILLITMISTAYFLSRNRAKAIFRPVTDLATAANKLADGTLVEDIRPTSDDELGDLTRSFNTMRKNLQQAQKKMILQEKLAAIGKLSGSVAHDIRNPLGVISNSIYYLNLISNNKTDPKIKKHISIMAFEIDRANRIINDLLDFSKDNVPIFAKGDINQLIQQVLSQFSFPDEITIDLSLDKNLTIIEFDQSQMQRVLSNLINNSQQAMHRGGRLKINTEYDKYSLQITISDDGQGISGENLEKIFEPLFTTKAKGVGLGLSIVKDLVNNHGGEIEVKSKVGIGSTFTIKLPLKNSLVNPNSSENRCSNTVVIAGVGIFIPLFG